jgi:hypothetical protein
MHVVEHHDSPGKDTTITHNLTLTRGTEIFRMLFKHGNECKKYYVLTIHFAHVSSTIAESLLLFFWRHRAHGA